MGWWLEWVLGCIVLGWLTDREAQIHTHTNVTDAANRAKLYLAGEEASDHKVRGAVGWDVWAVMGWTMGWMTVR